MIVNDNVNAAKYDKLFKRASKFLGVEIYTLNDYYHHMHDFFDKQGHEAPGFLMFTSDEGVINEDPLTINLNTRTINVPASISAGVQTDRMAEMLIFEVDRFFDVMDLANTTIHVKWETPEGKNAKNEIIPAAAGSTLVDLIDIVNKPGKMLFAWPITEDIAKASGTVKFSVRFFKEDDNGKLIYSLNTQQSSITIKPTLLSPDTSTIVVTPWSSNLFEDVILNSPKAPVGEKLPVVPWFAAPGSDIGIIKNGKPTALQMVDGRYIANLDASGSLTFCAQAVSSDRGIFNYKWHYSDGNNVTVADGVDFYNYVGIAQDGGIFVGVDEENNPIIQKPENNERYYTETYDEYTSNFTDNVALYERYTTYTVPAEGNVTGRYFVSVVSYFPNNEDLWEDGEDAASTPEIFIPRESSACWLPGPEAIAIEIDLEPSAFLQKVQKNPETGAEEIVPNPVNLIVDTGDNKYNATMSYLWEHLGADDDDYTIVADGITTSEKQDNSTLAVTTPGWYKVTISSTLNRKQADPVESSVCKVTNLPVVPKIENKTTQIPNGSVVNILELSKRDESVILKVGASLPEGSNENSELEHEEYIYHWFITPVNGEPRPLTAADAKYAEANGNQLTVYYTTDMEYCAFNCRVDNVLNGKTATSDYLEPGIFVDYKK